MISKYTKDKGMSFREAFEKLVDVGAIIFLDKCK